MKYIFISGFCVAPSGLKYYCLCLFAGVPYSDNSMVCFRRKAFLNSDMLAGFTISVALIWCIVIYLIYLNLALCIFSGCLPGVTVSPVPEKEV
jgi:hypothetical protein